MDPSTVVELAKIGGLALYCVALTYAVTALWKELGRERAARIAENMAATERALKLAEQNRDLALSANATTITNTAALDANKAAMEAGKASMDRMTAMLDRGRPQ